MCILLQVVPSGSKERLAFLARQMDVDILVTGHTHEFKVQYHTKLRQHLTIAISSNNAFTAC